MSAPAHRARELECPPESNERAGMLPSEDTPPANSIHATVRISAQRHRTRCAVCMDANTLPWITDALGAARRYSARMEGSGVLKSEFGRNGCSE